METYGADIIRLWALRSTTPRTTGSATKILKGVADQYRKLRNTFRYLLGALDGFDERERVSVDGMPELERYVLALLAELDATLRQAVDDFDFNTYTRALIDFCNEDLSALLLRHPQGPALLRRPRRSAAARLSHRARHAVPRADPLRRAGHGLYRRGSVAEPLSRRRQRALARMARSSRRSSDDASAGRAARAARE